MRAFLALAATAVMVSAPMSTAFAQPGYYQPGPPPGAWAYRSGDPCHEARRDAGNRGAVTGGILGALAGSMFAGRGHAVGGAVLGGAVGAVAGHEVARSNFRCVSYPYGYHPHPYCHWIVQDGRGFEVCRNPDGYWRPWRGY